MADNQDDGSIPLLEIDYESDQTDPDVFGSDQGHGNDTTLPRCMTCGRPTLESEPAFDQGKNYVLRGLFWILSKRLTKRLAAELAWLVKKETG